MYGYRDGKKGKNGAATARCLPLDTLHSLHHTGIATSSSNPWAATARPLRVVLLHLPSLQRPAIALSTASSDLRVPGRRTWNIPVQLWERVVCIQSRIWGQSCSSGRELCVRSKQNLGTKLCPAGVLRLLFGWMEERAASCEPCCHCCGAVYTQVSNAGDPREHLNGTAADLTLLVSLSTLL